MPRFDLPLSLDVEGRRCLVIGGGPEATDKAEKLLFAGAKVQVVATEVEPALEARSSAGELGWAARSWVPGDLSGVFLVYVTPDERESAREVWALRRTMGFLMCSIDDPSCCDFASPAVVRAGGVTLTIATGGRAPALAKRLREALEAALATPEFVEFTAELARRREDAPDGERAAEGKRGVEGLGLDVQIAYPDWFRDR